MAARGIAERRTLQFIVALAACVPVAAGAAGVVLGQDALTGGALDGAAESHVRYLSGLLLAVGLGFWSCVPGIHRKGARFRTLGLIVITGGLARLYGLVVDPAPSIAVLGPLAMELIVTPALILWRERVGGRVRLFGK